MEGHSEADHSEKTEEILEALAKRHSYSNLSEAAVNAGPYMSPEKLAAAASAVDTENTHVTLAFAF